MTDITPYTAIHWLMKKGVPLSVIAESTGLARTTLYRILQRGDKHFFYVYRPTRKAIMDYYHSYRAFLEEDKRVREEIGL